MNCIVRYVMSCFAFCVLLFACCRYLLFCGFFFLTPFVEVVVDSEQQDARSFLSSSFTSAFILAHLGGFDKSTLRSVLFIFYFRFFLIFLFTSSFFVFNTIFLSKFQEVVANAHKLQNRKTYHVKSQHQHTKTP